MEPDPKWGPRQGGVPVPEKQPASSNLSLPSHPSFLALWSIPLLVIFVTVFFDLTGLEQALPLVIFSLFFTALLYWWSIRRWKHACEALTKGAESEARIKYLREEWQRLALPENALCLAHDPYTNMLELTESSGGIFVGVADDTRAWETAPADDGVLVVGPSQSGKTSSVVAPGLLSVKSAAVVTSSKRDVFAETFQARSRLGRVWLFNPSSFESRSSNLPEGVLDLRWSPLRSASTWDGARQAADSMLSAVALSNKSEIGAQAKGLLASLMHAATLSSDGDMDVVRRWLMGEDFMSPLAVLSAVQQANNERSPGAQLAFRVLNGLARNRDREAIASVNEATDVYDSEHGREHARNPNFDVERFVESADTLYVSVSDEDKKMFAPVIAGLLNAIRSETSRKHRRAQTDNNAIPLLFMFDDAASTVPLPDLPDLMANAASHGLQVVACFQDFAQIRSVWGSDHGMLGKCRSKMIFPGVADKEDLETLSTIIGDWDRPYRTESGNSSTTYGPVGTSTTSGTSEQYSTQRERLLSPSEISQIPEGHAILVRNTQWSLVELLPFHIADAWQKIATEHAVVVPTGQPDLLESQSVKGLAQVDQLVAEFQKAPWQHHPNQT